MLLLSSKNRQSAGNFNKYSYHVRASRASQMAALVVMDVLEIVCGDLKNKELAGPSGLLVILNEEYLP